jgi:hypothetical protein
MKVVINVNIKIITLFILLSLLVSCSEVEQLDENVPVTPPIKPDPFPIEMTVDFNGIAYFENIARGYLNIDYILNTNEDTSEVTINYQMFQKGGDEFKEESSKSIVRSKVVLNKIINVKEVLVLKKFGKYQIKIDAQYGSNGVVKILNIDYSNLGVDVSLDQ